MKITKRQLRRIIKESLNETGDYSLSAEDMAWPDYDFVEANWLPWLEERGLSVDDLDDLAHYAGGSDRFMLDAHPPTDGMIGPADIEMWAEDQRAAREILSTRAGSYKGTTLPGGRKIK